MKAATENIPQRLPVLGISIHAAREGGDCRLSISDYADTEISIHAAREGGDPCKAEMFKRKALFQSTPPVKAATLDVGDVSAEGFDFNPRRP